MARTRVVEDRREQIIDAAVRVFARKGFVRATNKDIAQEAGITPGLIYHYFESKEALFMAIVEQRSPVRILHAVPPEMLKLSPEAFLRVLLTNILQLVESEEYLILIRAILPEMLLNPDLLHTVTTIMRQQAFVFLRSFFGQKIGSGELRTTLDPDIAAQMLLGSVITFVVRRQIIGDPEVLKLSQQQMVDTIIDALLLGFLPRTQE